MQTLDEIIVAGNDDFAAVYDSIWTTIERGGSAESDGLAKLKTLVDQMKADRGIYKLEKDELKCIITSQAANITFVELLRQADLTRQAVTKFIRRKCHAKTTGLQFRV